MSRPEALNTLREATKDVHAELETHLTLNRPDAGAPEYRGWARAMYGWLSDFEHTLWSSPWPEAVRASQRNGKRAWLAADLEALGDDAASLAQLPKAQTHLPLHTLAKRFGVAYVLEGSTLGGQVLLRRLAPKIAPSQGLYLNGYGDQTGPRWKAFSDALADSLASPLELEHAIAASRQAFSSLAQWFSLRGIG